ncbi:spermidine synthase [Serratia sp. M24T3]|uniref:spermidine synthase n=1 Tax=Serratia sp. M24T3 TaxID=932213 RepID=UPI00025BAE32|nr:fused MFS/spermidine synthase [Serratia sp. M24T3]EIC83405.1 spermidine synthase-like protein [Serratia sp. M24T3]
MNLVDDILVKLWDMDPLGTEIARETDDYGDIIVSEYKHYRMLRFDQLYEQSKMSMKAPAAPIHHYIKAMLMAISWCEGKSALLLGLGGGSLLRALHAHDANMQLDVVELRPKVLDIARRYFTLPDVPHITYYVEDAVDYLRRDTGQRYEFIFSDLYSAFCMDPLQGTEAFLKHCKASLYEGGWLIMNFLEMPHSHTLLHHALYRVFTDVFFCLTGSGNVIIYATSSRSGYQLKSMQIQAARLKGEGLGEMGHLSGRLERLL